MRRIELNTVRIAFGLALALPLSAALAACSPSAPDQTAIEEKFNEVLAEAEACDEAEVSPCVLVYPGCPLGPFRAVHRDKALSVDEAARSLLRQYALEDQVCAYQGEGVTAPDVECRKGKCEFFERAAPPAEGDAGE
jgi:hypothetical protein